MDIQATELFYTTFRQQFNFNHYPQPSLISLNLGKKGKYRFVLVKTNR